jgi:hypothetical protein
MERILADDYDTPWKEAIERYFADFLHFYFPQAYAQIDWSQPHVFLDQELRAVVQDAELGKRFVDKLVRVTRQGGQSEWVYVHLEVQGDMQAAFAERMFVYHYRLYDRYRKPIASLAVLADDQPHWQPESFSYDVFGCHHGLRFPVAKLLDWVGSETQLEDSSNPFAVVTLAHLATRATRNDAAARYAAKWTLVQGLYRRGWDKQQVIDLFKVLDWMMRLPKELDAQLWQNLENLEEEKHMTYISSVERIGIEKGFEKGIAQGIEKGIEQGIEQGMQRGQAHVLARQLTYRFGDLPAWVRERLDKACADELEAWAESVLSADSFEAVLGTARH